jgi:hypothetical protein
MANAVYPKFKKASVNGASPGTNYLGSNVRFALVDTDAYTYSASHEFLSDIPSGARISISGLLTSKAVSDACDLQSSNARFDAVVGATSEAVVMFIDSGTPSTSRLVFFMDTGVTNLPVTPDGSSYNLIAPSDGWCTL